MKKLVLSIAFVTAGFFAMTASAQKPCCKNQETCCKTEQSCCKDKAKGEKPSRPNPMEGLNLTPEQQQAVDALNQKYAQKRKDALKEKGEAAAKARKEGKDTKKAYLEELKGILTPEQYTQYLENQVAKAPKAKAMKQGAHKKRGEVKGKAKEMRGQKKAQKGIKQPEAAKAE